MNPGPPMSDGLHPEPAGEHRFRTRDAVVVGAIVGLGASRWLLPETVDMGDSYLLAVLVLVTVALAAIFGASMSAVRGFVALFGGFLLIAQPFEEQGEVVPGAASGGPGTFSPAGSLAEGRGEHTATLLPDGRVLVVGGWGDGDIASAEVWDPATASSSAAGAPIEPRTEHTATLLNDGRVLIVGGQDFYGSGRTTAEVWDPATASFAPTGSLAEGHARHTATLLSDGRVLVIGGRGRSGDPFLASAEVWDPATASFGPAGSLAEAVDGHTATLLSGGRVLVVGGRSGDYPAWPEVWNPVTESFTPAGPLAERRWLHTATLLSDGRVLVVGGGSRVSNEILASAEVWEPDDG